MTECPHCGTSLPSVSDPFCPECREALDEPVVKNRTPEEKAATAPNQQRETHEDLERGDAAGKTFVPDEPKVPEFRSCLGMCMVGVTSVLLGCCLGVGIGASRGKSALGGGTEIDFGITGGLYGVLAGAAVSFVILIAFWRRS